jgi:hypothetical protein
MILKESYSAEWIRGIQQEHRIDPILIEKVILALTLLEQLKISGLEFVFKGGTSLLLLFGEPRRLSIDIDIIVNPRQRTLLEGLLNMVVEQGVFNNYEKNERVMKADIPKAHYKFYFQSVITGRNDYVLLDVLFEENHYTQIINISVCSKFTKCDDNMTEVKIPSVNCILGDKLTAFAPNTTGIRYGDGKELEIIKQLFDVANLFDLADNLSIVKDNFDKIATQEIIYRGIELTSVDVLMDIFETASIITYRGIKAPDCYNELFAGIKKINSYIFNQSFNLEIAILCASKAAYLSMILMKNLGAIEKFKRIEDMETINIENPEFSKFNKLKKTDPQAFYYWCKAVELYGGIATEEKPFTIGTGTGVSI